MKRKRGRPRNITKEESQLDNAKKKLDHMMTLYEYNCSYDEQLNIKSRRSSTSPLPAELLSKDFDIGTENIKSALDEYNSYNQIIRSFKANKNFVDDDEKITEEEEEEKEDDLSQFTITPNKTTREMYLSKKKPIENYCEGSFEQLSEISQYILNERKDEIFSENVTYQGQVENVINLIYNPCRNSNSGPSAIGRLFGVNRGTISQHFERMQNPRNEFIGRPPDLDPYHIKLLNDYVIEQYNEQNPPTIDHLTNFLFCKHNISINPDTLSSILRKLPHFKSVIASPLEQTRFDVQLDEIIEYYNELDSLLIHENIPPQFVFNVDESGFQDFCDSHNLYVIVPSDANDEDYHYSVDRTTKRITLIGAICLDGSSLKPCIVSPNKTIEQELVNNGYNESNCIIVSQESGFINAELFSYWANEVFFKELAEKRNKYEYTGTALLLLDGCSSHFSNMFLDDCTYYNTYPFPEPPGSSDQVQSLDLGIFSIQKKQRSRDKLDGLNSIDNMIRDIVNSWRKATLPDNVVSAFHQSGIYIETNSNASRARASIEYARAVRGIDHQPSRNILISSSKTIKLKHF